MNGDALEKIKLSVLDRWSKRQIVQRHFFIKWKNEYLLELCSKNKRTENKEVKEGDIVLVLNERRSKRDWPLARVEQVYKSHDGIVRSVLLRLPIETKKSAKKSDNKGLVFDSAPRFTTRGVENIHILEETTSVDEDQRQHERVTNSTSPNTINELSQLD